MSKRSREQQQGGWAGKYIDHTLLKPEATLDEIEKVCDEALAIHAKSVCTNSYWTSVVAAKLSDQQTIPCAVVGFPLGAALTAVKALETTLAIQEGAREIDMVINVGALKSGVDKDVAEDIEAVVHAAKETSEALSIEPVGVKVILETALLTKDEIVRACRIATISGADFVKTSTGFAAAGGATVETVRLMKETVTKLHAEDKTLKQVSVKASGGVRNLQQMIQMIEAGADRIGCSKSVEICQELISNPIDEPIYKPQEKKARSVSPRRREAASAPSEY
jgi:deoxyribose-phosphate aldolase